MGAGNNYKKLLSGIVVVSSLGATNAALAKVSHTGPSGGGDSSRTFSNDRTGNANINSAEALLRDEVDRTYNGVKKPEVEVIDGSLNLKPQNDSVQAYNDMMDWLYSRDGVNGSSIVVLGGRFFVNVARAGEAEQLVRIALPPKPVVPSEPGTGGPGKLVP